MTAVGTMTASKLWSATVEPLLKRVGKLYGAAGLATAFEAYKSMGGKVPSIYGGSADEPMTGAGA